MKNAINIKNIPLRKPVNTSTLTYLIITSYKKYQNSILNPNKFMRKLLLIYPYVYRSLALHFEITDLIFVIILGNLI